MKGKIRFHALLAILLLMFGGISSAASQTQPPPELEEEALRILKESMAFLAKAPRFQISGELGFDVVQESGQKIEFGASRRVTVRRPDKARIEFTRRDGVEGKIVFDGKKLLLFDKDEKVYAQTSLPGDLEEALDYMADTLQMPVPLRDFFVNDPYLVLAERLDSGRYVGESVIAGTVCDHLAFRNDRVDFQIWIARGETPLPRRFLISYKKERGEPQFWIQFHNWDLAPHLPDEIFSTEPPEGAKRIPLAILEPSPKAERGNR